MIGTKVGVEGEEVELGFLCNLAMKIARYRDAGGGVHHSQLLDDGRLERLSGDLYGCLIPSGEIVESFQLLAPLDPCAVLCIGLNYHRHAEELGAPVPEYPVLFMKSPAAVQNPGDPIELPTSLASEQVDYEGELAVVIGRRCNAKVISSLDLFLSREKIPPPLE